MLISPEYLELQRELHSRGSYGLSSGRWAKPVSVLAAEIGATAVLDYGCGQGYLKQKLADFVPFPIYEYDPAIEGKDEPPSRADLVFCGDVLEHIEPSFLEAVLDDLMRLAQKAVLLVVATCPAAKHLADGRNAHLIVEPWFWWGRRFDERWRLANFAGTRGEFHYVGLAK